MRRVYKSIFFLIFFALFSVIFSPHTQAQITLTPLVTSVASLQQFTLNVIASKDLPVTTIALVLPHVLTKVIPDVKPEWTINTIKTGDQTSEIDWSDGEIPSGLQDTFTFTAIAPSTPTTLSWKIYITYADGSTVSWDQNPKIVNKNKQGNPFIITNVVQITPSPYASKSDETHTAQKANLGFVLSIVGIVLASVALSIARRKNPLMTQEKSKRIRKR